MKVFDKGERVCWNGRRAGVAYVRFAPPDYSTPEEYSIVLDDQRHRLDYSGTIVKAAEVKQLYYCCSKQCPGYSYRASWAAHPPETCTP